MKQLLTSWLRLESWRRQQPRPGIEPGDKVPIQEVQDDSQSWHRLRNKSRPNRSNSTTIVLKGWIAQGDYDKAFADYHQALQLLHSYDTMNMATAVQ